MVLENELWALFRGKIFIPEIQPYPGPCLCVCITKPRGIGGLAFGERQCTSISALIQILCSNLGRATVPILETTARKRHCHRQHVTYSENFQKWENSSKSFNGQVISGRPGISTAPGSNQGLGGQGWKWGGKSRQEGERLYSAAFWQDRWGTNCRMGSRVCSRSIRTRQVSLYHPGIFWAVASPIRKMAPFHVSGSSLYSILYTSLEL